MTRKRLQFAPVGALAHHVQLAVGSRVRLTQTLSIDIGLVNGATGTVVGFRYDEADRKTANPGASVEDIAATFHNPAIPTVLVQFDAVWYGHKIASTGKKKDGKSYGDWTLPRVVPITATTDEEKMFRFQLNGVSYTRTMLPLTLSTATTVHTAQGLTCSQHVMQPAGDRPAPANGRNFTRGLLYVQLSRVETAGGLFLLGGLEEKDFTISFMPTRLSTST